MTEIIFATNNLHKLSEVQELLGNNYKLVTPKQLGIMEDIPEEADTLEGNASQKSFYLFDRTGKNCFADDTGLEVDALNGAPGVYSARYAGLEKSDKKNIALLLERLEVAKNRKAQFRTVISLILNGVEHQFEGIVKGEIRCEPIGNDGFGYDPIFVPEGWDRSFAQMTMEEKNAISHRGRAVRALVEFLLKNEM